MNKVSRALVVYRKEGLAGLTRRINQRWVREYAKMQRLLQFPVVSSAYGIRVAANWDDATFRFYVEGAYGFFLADLLRNQDRPFHFMDIGANQGLYSILAVRNPTCRSAVALEPVPTTAAVLKRNLSLNGFEQRVEVIQAALSDKMGRAVITLPSNHSGGATLRAVDLSALAQQVEIDLIDANGLAQWTAEPGVPIIVKVDVEGHENTVIKELMKSNLAQAIEMIFYECDEAWVNSSTIEQMLRNEGFKQFERIGSGNHYDVLARR